MADFEHRTKRRNCLLIILAAVLVFSVAGTIVYNRSMSETPLQTAAEQRESCKNTIKSGLLKVFDTAEVEYEKENSQPCFHADVTKEGLSDRINQLKNSDDRESREWLQFRLKIKKLSAAVTRDICGFDNGSVHFELSVLDDIDAANAAAGYETDIRTLLELRDGKFTYDIAADQSEAAFRRSLRITENSEKALERALAYLDVLGFSHEGLIHQLELEDFTSDEAAYAADNCGADWNEQAVRRAEFYLGVLAMSGKELRDQLEFEGFTREQALYGVQNCGLEK
ncbi:MAG: Ltp family lipoprotein [Candidatus Limivicinus sp.]